MGHVHCALVRIAGDGMIKVVMVADIAISAAASSRLAARSVVLIF
jgi:hypothetical protein